MKPVSQRVSSPFRHRVGDSPSCSKRVVAAPPIMRLVTQEKEPCRLTVELLNPPLSPSCCHHPVQSKSCLIRTLQRLPPPVSSPHSQQNLLKVYVGPPASCITSSPAQPPRLLRAWTPPTAPASCLLAHTQCYSHAEMFLLPPECQVFPSPLDFCTCSYTPHPGPHP